MKRALAVLFVTLMTCSVCACGQSQEEKWADEDFVFYSEDEGVVVTQGHAFIAYENTGYLTADADSSYQQYDAKFSTERGLKIGMTMEELKTLYEVTPMNAVWELYSGNENQYNSFKAYNEEAPGEMYDDTYHNVWLDLGFVKVDDEWVSLNPKEIQDIWFCNADYEAYGEVALFAVNFDTDGLVSGISVEHLSYDESWAVSQGWKK